MTSTHHRRIPRVRMSGRDIDEGHRVSTSLELLFDLTFVVAVAAAAAQLHHAVAEHHLASGLFGFVAVFFAIWWAWMNFTWFASAYDTDDTTYRLWTMVQMVGALILAVGVPDAAAGRWGTVTVGYVVMRVGAVAMWLRAAREHPERRGTAWRYAVGIVVVQALWLARLALPQSLSMVAWGVLVLAELAIPMWAAKAGHTPWHAHHIAERYGLFTIIVLGECVLGASRAIGSVLEVQGWSVSLALAGLGSVGLILALWWVYFQVPHGQALHHHRDRAFKWGYIHVLVFGSVAAIGAFLGVVADGLRPAAAAGAAAAAPGGHAVSPVLALGLLAAATAVYLGAVAWIRGRIAESTDIPMSVWIGIAIWLAASVLAVHLGASLAVGLVLVALGPAFAVAWVLWRQRDGDHRAAA